MKSNEVVQADGEGVNEVNPDDYRVTLHCFFEHSIDRRIMCHGSTSDLGNGSSVVPDDLIFDVVYAANLFHSYKAGPVPFLEEYRNEYYGPSEVKQREDRADKRKKKEDTKNESKQDEEDSDSDSEEPDIIILVNLWLNGTSWQEMKEKRAAVKEAGRQRKMQELEDWRNAL